MSQNDFTLLQPLREQFIKSIVFGDSVSVKDFFNLTLSDEDQLNFVYYLTEFRQKNTSNPKALNMWAIALARHQDINQMSINYLLSFKHQYINKKLYQNESVDSTIKNKIFLSTSLLRCELAKKTTNLDLIQKFLKDSSLKVRRSLLKNPFLYDQNHILEQMTQDTDLKVSKDSKELLDMTDLEVRKLCMTDESFQFEIED